MKKNEILEEYFLEETEKTDELTGWKVIGISKCESFSSGSQTMVEFKTKSEGWLCEFKIKILNCGIVLVSPEYMVDDSELIMEAIEKYIKTMTPLTEELKKLLEKPTPISAPYDPDTTITTSPGIWTSNGTEWWTNTITCTGTNTYTSLDNSAVTAYYNQTTNSVSC